MTKTAQRSVPMGVFNAREPTAEEKALVRKDLRIIRDSGIRILVAQHDYSNILADRISGHLIIGPSEGSPLGIDISEENRKRGKPRPHVIKQPYLHCVETGIVVGRTTCLLYRTNEDLCSQNSLAKGSNSMYRFGMDFMLGTGLFKRSG